MNATRIGTLQWATGVYCALLGALILVAPHQFRTPDYAGSQLRLPWWGGAILLAGIGLLSVPVLKPAQALRAAAHVVAGTVLLTLAAAFAAAGGWTAAAGNAVLGGGLILAGLMVRRLGGQAGVFGLLMGLSAL